MGNANLQINIGLAHEMQQAFRKADWTPDLIKRAIEEDTFSAALDLLRGDVELVRVSHVIDADSEPMGGREGCSVVFHQPLGALEWRSVKTQLFEPMQSEQLREETYKPEGLHSLCPDTYKPRYLRGKTPLNANVRDYLQRYPHLVPKAWNVGHPVLFWGTVFRDEAGYLYVPGLRNNGYGDWSKYHFRIEEPGYELPEHKYPCALLNED